MPLYLRTKNNTQLDVTLQISQFKSDTLQTIGYTLSTPSIFFYLYGFARLAAKKLQGPFYSSNRKTN